MNMKNLPLFRTAPYLVALMIVGSAASAAGPATAPGAPAKAPTWRDYKDGTKAFPKDAEKRKQYNEAAVSALLKEMKASPSKEFVGRDRVEAGVLCVHAMYIEGVGIMHGPDIQKMESTEEVEDLIKSQQHDLTVMKSAYSALKRLNPTMADKVGFEITKCNEVIAKTQARLEEVQKTKQQ
jgi:hypothetical protein